MTQALGGGWVLGRQVLLWGSKSSGKTAFSLQQIALAQQQGLSCVFFDVEGTFDPVWAKSLGVNLEDLIMVSEVKTFNDFTKLAVDFMHAGVDVMVVDSISVLVPGSYFAKDDELKELDGTKQIGAESRDVANMCRMLNYANSNTLLILISQERNKITSYGAMRTPTGGKSVEFYSTTSVKLTSSATDKSQVKEKVHRNGVVVERSVAKPIDWEIVYNKSGPPAGSGTYTFYYYGDTPGVDNIGEIVDVGKEMGIIVQTGAWFVLYEERYQGKARLLEAIRDNEDLYAKLVGDINGTN